jgi:hypothetical protein
MHSYSSSQLHAKCLLCARYRAEYSFISLPLNLHGIAGSVPLAPFGEVEIDISTGKWRADFQPMLLAQGAAHFLGRQ